MKKYQIISLTLVFAIMASVAIAWASRDSDEEALLLAKTKLSLTQAIDTALAQVPGKALSAELSDENRLAYLVEVVQQNRTYEVTVDALNGKILGKSMDKIDAENHDREDRD